MKKMLSVSIDYLGSIHDKHIRFFISNPVVSVCSLNLGQILSNLFSTPEDSSRWHVRFFFFVYKIYLRKDFFLTYYLILSSFVLNLEIVFSQNHSQLRRACFMKRSGHWKWVQRPYWFYQTWMGQKWWVTKWTT